jgi:lysophospholipase L1-like esterase
MQSRILVIGDSLCIPRASSTYEDTWIYKLKILHPSWDIITLCEGSRTTNCLRLEKAATGSNCLFLYKPNIVILQLGIVDCAPRLFPANSMLEKILRRSPDIFSTPVIGWIKKRQGRKSEYADVSLSEFKSNLEHYFDACSAIAVSKVLVVAIAYPDDRMISKNPLIISVIVKYNAIFRQLARNYKFVHVVEPLRVGVSKNLLYEDDGYHFKPSAHDLVVASLEKAISETNHE